MPATETEQVVDDAATLDDLNQLGDDPALDNIDPDTGSGGGETQVDSGAASTQQAADTTSTTTQAAATQAQPSFVERARSRNLPFTAQDDDGLVNELGTFFERDFPQVRQLAGIGQEFYTHQNEIRQWLAERQQQQANATGQRQDAAPGARSAGPGAVGDWIPLPEYDPNWENFVEYENGIPVRVKPGGQLDLHHKVAAYNDAIAKRSRDVLTRLPELVQQFATTGIDDRINAAIEARFAAEERNRFVNDAISQNESWMFDLDASGQRQYDAWGKPRLTEKGLRYQQEVATLAKLGMTDDRFPPQVQHYLAMRLVGEVPGQQQVNQPPTQAELEAQRKQQLVERQRGLAARNGGRGGSATNQKPGQLSPDQNKALPPDKLLREAFDVSGVTDDDFAELPID